MQIIWKGEENRKLGVYRPCSCGCDGDAVGFLSGSNENGDGFTIEIESEEVYEALSKLF